MDTVELSITESGKSYKYKVNNAELKLLSLMLKWMHETDFGLFTITKKGDKMSTNESETRIL